jgi:hypothetical protein
MTPWAVLVLAVGGIDPTFVTNWRKVIDAPRRLRQLPSSGLSIDDSAG